MPLPHRSLHYHVLTALMALVLLSACQSTPVTSTGKEVMNQTIATATRAVHVAELAATTVTDTLTAEFKAGRVKAEVLQQFQAEIAPRVSAALASARLALKTLNDAPESTPAETVIRAVLALQAELATLQGFWLTHALIPSGGIK